MLPSSFVLSPQIIIECVRDVIKPFHYCYEGLHAWAVLITKPEFGVIGCEGVLAKIFGFRVVVLLEDAKTFFKGRWEDK